jgi:hypothetical protein
MKTFLLAFTLLGCLSVASANEMPKECYDLDVRATDIINLGDDVQKISDNRRFEFGTLQAAACLYNHQTDELCINEIANAIDGCGMDNLITVGKQSKAFADKTLAKNKAYQDSLEAIKRVHRD